MNNLCTCERSVRTRSETLTNRCNICGKIIIQFSSALTGNIECEPVYQNIESDNSLNSEDEFDDIEECECNENQAGERCDYCLNQTTQNKDKDIEQTKTLIDAYSDTSRNKWLHKNQDQIWVSYMIVVNFRKLDYLPCTTL